MSWGTLLGTLLALCGGSDAGAVKEYHINQHSIRIPISIDSPAQRAQIRELILYVSTDAGKTWNQQAVASPEQDAFSFLAPQDGTYWFSVSVVDQAGKREPENIYNVPPSQKIVIDTLKPLVRIQAAERVGDDIRVKWEIQEDHPDWKTFRLESKAADAPPSAWTQATAPAQAIGQARIHVSIPGSISLRLQVADLAGNVGVGGYEVPGTAGNSGTILASGQVPAPSKPAAAPPPPVPPPNSAWDSSTTAKPSPVPSMETPKPVRIPPMETQPALSPAPPAMTLPDARSSAPPMPSRSSFDVTPPSFPPADGSHHQLVATSEKTAIHPAPTPPGLRPDRLTANSMPPLQIVNNRQIALNYEITKQGPSKVGKVELWMTRDDGRNWEKFAEAVDPTPPLRVNLPAEGVYGFRLVLQSRAGRRRPAPVSGDTPEMRVELDTTPPAAQLYRPEPDPKQNDALILSWSVSDRNLDPNPITVQWADKPGGPWQTILADAPNNDGHYVWKLPPSIPFMVYLRLITKDTAGNASTAETPDPICIDLTEPEGRLIGIAPSLRRE